MCDYEIGLLGDVLETDRATLESSLKNLVADYDLRFGRDIAIRVGGEFEKRERRASAAAAYFGGTVHADRDPTERALAASVPIIPTVKLGADFGTSIPLFLQSLNGLRLRSDDPQMCELAVALLECVGLLRRQRRVFVSYRRVEARNAAVQLHDVLSGRGFDVFLDTHDIRPGEHFQDVLWHRLCDSDVLLMLDTATYFEKKWTRQELGRARAKEIHVLRVVWPDHTPTRHTDFAETVYLNRVDLQGHDGPIVDKVVNDLVLAVENLRSRSIASRYMSITGKLRAEVTKIGGIVEGVGSHRAIAVKLPDDSKIWCYPIVGIPTAELLNDVAEKAHRADQHEVPVLIYDHVGIHDQWIAHLKWLDDNIKTVRAIRVAEAAWTLAAWESRV